MNLLDLIIIVIMIFLIVRGIFRGFIREVSSLAGVILGIWLATLYHPQMTDYLREYLPTFKFLQIFSFAVIFTIVLVLCNLFGWSLRMILKKTSLGWTDRILGASLSILKGVIVIYLAIIILTFFVPSKAPLIARSNLAPLIIASYQSMVSLISPGSYENWKRKFVGQKERIEKAVSEKIESLTGEDGSQ